MSAWNRSAPSSSSAPTRCVQWGFGHDLGRRRALLMPCFEFSSFPFVVQASWVTAAKLTLLCLQFPSALLCFLFSQRFGAEQFFFDAPSDTGFTPSRSLFIFPQYASHFSCFFPSSTCFPFLLTLQPVDPEFM